MIVIETLSKINRLLSMPLYYMWTRIKVEFFLNFFFTPLGVREKNLNEKKLLKYLNESNMDSLHARIISQKSPWNSFSVTSKLVDTVSPNEVDNILKRANLALNGFIHLLGSDLVNIGNPEKIQWHKDVKSGLEWEFSYFSKIDPSDLGRPSDVKTPWELSRMQWLIPIAQAWKLTENDKYAAYLKSVVESWLDSNPYAWGVNWSCTMEPSMRIFVWCWLYRMLENSPSWQDKKFRFRFLQGVYLHLEFINRYIEISDINGNHLTSNAAALVVGGSFFGKGKVLKWKNKAWKLLEREIQLQVYEDGVSFEGSTYYHRLVAELFYVAAVSVDILGGKVSLKYQNKLLKMANYIESYTRPDGLPPVIGDNDNACVMNFSGKSIRDHRYLSLIIKFYFDKDNLTGSWKENSDECIWWIGHHPEVFFNSSKPEVSQQFKQSGNFILRNNDNYIFFDSGSLGLSGRGGHDHNDMLSFELMLDGCLLVSDPGCFTYTGNWRLRDKYRSTEVHNTIQVNNEEINRFIIPKNMWSLSNDSECKPVFWKDNTNVSIAGGMHTGYMRLSLPLTTTRYVVLDKNNNSFACKDALIGATTSLKSASITLQLSEDVLVESIHDNYMLLSIQNKHFVLDWSGWPSYTNLRVSDSKVSPQYGVELDAIRVRLTITCPDKFNVFTAIYPGKQKSLELCKSLSDKLDNII
jgi:hypothetical protein